MQEKINKNFNCVAVVGPTASGKTALAAQLAAALDGEVVSADSRQVYDKLDIGTGKDLDQYILNGKAIPYHLIGIRDVSTQYYLHDFTADLRKCFDDIITRNKMPVICGGSGLYLDALRKNFEITQVPENHELRLALEDLSKSELIDKLKTFPPEHVAFVDRSSVKRITRGIEVAEFLSKNNLKPKLALPYLPYYVGILATKEKIAERIKTRLEHRLKHGLIEEVERLLTSGVSHQRLETLGLEYKFIGLFLKKELSMDEMKERLFIAIRQFSKRQMTWFRKMEKEGVKINWVNDPVDTFSVITQVRKALTS